MSIGGHLKVPYHQQDTDYYCGAACSQMVLDEIGMGLQGQTGLYNENHSHSVAEPGWYTAPDGLQWTMNHRQHHKYFALDALGSEDAISRMIAWTIHHYKVSAIALVYGSAHWIVVRGYTANAQPTSSSDTSYSIVGFDVNNPWPPCPSFYHQTPAHPPPHSHRDKCGTGGSRGVANEHISYATWQSTYMTGVPGGYWGGKFVALCDPDPPPTAPPNARNPLMEPLPAELLITPSQAAQQAMAGIDAYDLRARDDYKSAMRSAEPSSPILVERLDHPNSYYYIVPIAGRSGDHVPLAVIVDGRTGVYSQSVVSAAGQENVLSVNSPEQAAAAVIGREIQLPEKLGRLHVLPQAVSQHPAMVWKPCRESLSPYYPFHLFTSGGHPIYVRSDGMVFTELHDQDRGL